MKVFFANTPFSEAITDFLDHNNIGHFQSEELPKQLDPEYFLLIYTPRELEDVSKVASARQANAVCNFAVVLNSEWLGNVNLYGHLMQSQIEFTWTEDTWETMFLLNFKAALHTYQERIRREGDLESLLHQSEALLGQVETNIQLASNIQKRVSPTHHTLIPGVSLTTKYIPSKEGKGGNYFDFFEIEEKRKYGFLVADSESHAFAAQLLTALLQVQLPQFKSQFAKPHDFIKFLVKEMMQHYKEGFKNISLFFAVLDRPTLKMEYAFLGENYFLILREHVAENMTSKKLPALNNESQKEIEKNLQTHKTQLLPNDQFIITTSGLGPLLTKSLLDKFIKEEQSSHVVDLQNSLVTEFKNSQNASNSDMTLIIGKIDSKTMFVA